MDSWRLSERDRQFLLKWPKLLGAGEGNGTLVFGLEGFRRLNIIKVSVLWAASESHDRALIEQAPSIVGE
jgi:hypothetical protein